MVQVQYIMCADLECVQTWNGQGSILHTDLNIKVHRKSHWCAGRNYFRSTSQFVVCDLDFEQPLKTGLLETCVTTYMARIVNESVGIHSVHAAAVSHSASHRLEH